jgi:hypothetical protein
MRRLATLFLFLALGLALIGSPAQSQDIRINPVPPDVKPQWTKIPEVPQVSWAPNLPTDVFRYRRKYYFFWEGYFYRSHHPEGPWKAVQQVPEVFYKVNPSYFKTVKKAAGTPPAPEQPAPEQPAPEQKARIIEVPPATPPPPAPPAPVEPQPEPREPQPPVPRVM